VVDYNGTTKVATVDHDWDVNPDATTGYVMLPAGLSSLSAVAGTPVTGLSDVKFDPSVATNPKIDGVTWDEAQAMAAGLGTVTPAPAGGGSGSHVVKTADGATVIGTKAFTTDTDDNVIESTFTKAP